MSPDKQQAACDLLYRHWQDGTRLENLPPDLRPATRAEAYAVQGCIETYTDQPLYGWKIAATSAAGQKHIGVDGPLAGRLLAERVIADGGVCLLGSNLMKVAEVEFAFRMGRDLAPRPEPYTQAEVMDAVATLHPAIEIPDSRYEHFETVGLAQLVADNACAHRFVLGPAAPEGWRGLDLAAHPGRALKNGAVAGEGIGSNVLGGPVTALTWLANELAQHGLTLAAGQVVTTGTCLVPLPIAAGDQIEGDLGSVGRVSVSIA
jgi:2-keto-4-pentenoate hydratase